MPSIVFDQVTHWPAWVGIETAIFWQCSPGTVATQRLYPLRHGLRRAINIGFFGLINPIICSPYLVFHSRVRTESCNCLYWESFLRWGFLICVLILSQTFVLILVVLVKVRNKINTQGLTRLQRSSRCILLPQPTEQGLVWFGFMA